MSELSRIGVAIDSDLLAAFDDYIARKGYTNRSEAFRDLIRRELVREQVANPKAEVVATLTLIYNHHVRLLSERLTDLQHEHYNRIISTLHVHLDQDHCLEVLILRGKASEVQKIADTLISTRGVRHGELTLTSLEVDR